MLKTTMEWENPVSIEKEREKLSDVKRKRERGKRITSII